MGIITKEFIRECTVYSFIHLLLAIVTKLCTLPREERCAYPVKSTCASTTSQLPEHVGIDACHQLD